MDDARLEAFEEMVKGLCDEFNQPYQGLDEDLNPYTEAFETVFLVPGELYDLRVMATIEREKGDPEYNRVYFFLSAYNVVQIRSRKDLHLHATVDEGPSGDASPDVYPDMSRSEIKTDEDFKTACSQVRQKFLDEFLPLQTIENLVADIRQAKGD